MASNAGAFLRYRNQEIDRIYRDAAGRPVDFLEPLMGLSLFKASSCACPAEPTAAPSLQAPPLPRGKPAATPPIFEVTQVIVAGTYVAIRARYPESKNFEGIKILVLEASLAEVAALRWLDPHFCDNGHLAPIARFAPTAQGWILAADLVRKLGGSP